MGEYATYRDTRIKIGTCEDMYYLRPDQLHLVESPVLRDLTALRFRFPFPDEDHLEPGAFEDHDRGLTVRGYDVPTNVDHHTVQFKADAGILVSLPCPYSEQATTSGPRYHFNGFRGPARIVQQRIWAGVWVTVVDCGPCGARFRLPDLDAAQPLLAAILREVVEAERAHDTKRAETWRTVADRVERGYHTAAPTTGTD